MSSCKLLCLVLSLAFYLVHGYPPTYLPTGYTPKDKVKEIATSAIKQQYEGTVKQYGGGRGQFGLSFTADRQLIDARTGHTDPNGRHKSSMFENLLRQYRRYKSLTESRMDYGTKTLSFKEFLDKYAPAPEIRRRFKVGIVDPRTRVKSRAGVSVTVDGYGVKQTFEPRIVDPRTSY